MVPRGPAGFGSFEEKDLRLFRVSTLRLIGARKGDEVTLNPTPSLARFRDRCGTLTRVPAFGPSLESRLERTGANRTVTTLGGAAETPNAYPCPSPHLDELTHYVAEVR